MKNKFLKATLAFAMVAAFFSSCKPKNSGDVVSGDAAQKAYVAPGKYDEFYNFVSGGFAFGILLTISAGADVKKMLN